MPASLYVDFVSDISCPWCAIGLASLQIAVARLAGDMEVEVQFQPFELNPQMAPEGEDIDEHLQRKYGSTPQQAAAVRETIRERGAAVGFTFNMGQRTRIYNTFDAHRLLHWAHAEGRQLALKKALFRAYFTQGLDPSNHPVLLDAVDAAGLDRGRAAEVLASDAHAADVRSQEQFFQSQGIHSVPAVIINRRYLVSGGQPPEVFEQALRQAAENR